ncbi:MAG: phosphopantothenoylcysteine decarboxylase [Lentisphaeria bacterium]|nr:phosphopantothenoylcysteine decarboxylase [Lentisphaeria bacterium]
MKIVISAGPTREFIDPIRFISNSSSGQMGYAVAAEALRRGHEVVLVSGPVAIKAPEGAVLIPVVSAADMAEAVKREFAAADCCIMSAAVADYRPAKILDHKMKKSPGNMVIELERTEDILKALGEVKRPGQLLVGFAAESENLLENAAGKLARKNLDWIVANNISDGFAKTTNACILLGRNGEKIPFSTRPKTELAAALLDAIGI